MRNTDGHVAFVDECTAVVSAYPKSCSEHERKYVDLIAHKLMDLGLNVVRIQDNPGDHNGRESHAQSYVGSANGNYVNFLQLNDPIILPEYAYGGVPGGLDYNAVNREIMAPFVDDVSIDCDAPAAHGGVLHCISPTDRSTCFHGHD